MRKHKWLILALVVLLGTVPLFATDYYVKNGGNDGASGLDDANAWETINKVNITAFNAGDNIYFKVGNTWREQLTVPSSGSSGNQITFGAYGSGADPIINGSVDLTSATYKWTASSRGTNEYYCEIAAGGDPSLTEPLSCWLDDTHTTNGTEGSLNDHEWDWAAGRDVVIDAETGDETEWTSTTTTGTNTFTATEGSKNSGTYGFDADFDGTNVECYGYKTFTTATDVYARFYIKLSADFTLTGTWVAATVFELRDGATVLADFMIREAGEGIFGWRMQVKETDLGGATWADTALNTWYRIELHYKKDGSVGGGEWWVDGASQGSDFTMDTSANDADRILVGGISDTAPDVGNIYYDDIIVDTAAIGAYSAPEIDYGTVFFADATGDPDVSGVVFEAGSLTTVVNITTKNYITLDGLNLQKNNANWTGVLKISNGSNNTIQNCTISEGYHSNIHIYYSAAATTGNVIDNCTISNCYYTSQVVIEDQTDGNTIQDCVFSGSTGTGADFIYFNGADSTIIQNNTLTGPVTNGIYVKAGASSNIIRYNYIYAGSSGVGIQCRGDSAVNDDNEFYYNIIDQCGLGIQTDGDFGAGNDGTLIYNNIVYATTSGDNGIHISGTNTNCVVKNNIAVMNDGDALKVEAASAAGTTSDYNCFRNSSGTLISWDGTNYTLAQFATYQAAKSQDANSFTSDPLMTDPANDDFTLQKTSPCINAGTGVGLTQDYGGTLVPKGSAPDIGAYEYFKAIIMGMLRWQL